MSSISCNNVTRIKNISHKDQATGQSAYLSLSEQEFILHYPNRLSKTILAAGCDEIIILYQKIRNRRYYTHLVQPIDNEIVENSIDPNYRFGRYVRIIAFTGRDGRIPIEKGPKIDLRNSFGSARELTGIIAQKNPEEYQQQIWRLFKPFMDLSLVDNSQNRHLFHNDELETDFESIEGKLLFANHRRRERDSHISHRKKNEAIRKGNLFCEVCAFSFISTFGQDYIECHHIVPINKGERITKMEDLALVCSNCHRMLHRKIGQEYLSIDQLRQLYVSSKTN